jgi:hypothetical protein
MATVFVFAENDGEAKFGASGKHLATFRWERRIDRDPMVGLFSTTGWLARAQATASSSRRAGSPARVGLRRFGFELREVSRHRW